MQIINLYVIWTKKLDIGRVICEKFLLRNRNIFISNITRIVANQKYFKTSAPLY